MQLKIILLLLLLPSLLSAQCWKDIASKSDHVLAIHVDGTLWQWGGNQLFYRGQKTPTLLNSDTTWKQIASGTGFYAAVKGDGTLWMWGDNSYGQLGIGNTTNNWNPVQVGTATDWKDVSCGEGHTVALKTDGTLWAWGRNNYGQLSTGLGRINSSIPIQVGTDSNWKEISAGRYHTLAKKTTNQLFFIGACYGAQVSQPNLVTTATDWADFTASAYVDYAIKQNGTLWKWVHSAATASGVTQVGTAANWSKVASSHGTSIEEHALLIKTNGTLWAIGKNQFGQLGNGTLTEATSPVQIGTATDWSFVCAGLYTSFALKTNNSLWVWGMNQHTQFGNYKNKNVFQPIASPSSWKTASTPISSFGGHTLAIASNGTLWSWGQNNDGQLGIGTTYTHKVLPVQVGTAADWKQVTNGNFASLAIRENGTLWAWGRNTYGVLGTGTGSSNILTPYQVGSDTTWNQISAGNEHVLALKENGTLWVWGRNNQGQLGIGSTVDQATPVQVGIDTTWVWVSAGLQFSTALKSDGTLWTWGSNSHGQLGRTGATNIPGSVSSSTPWKTIAAGGYHTLGIKQDSTLWAWGRNDSGQMGNNTSTNASTPFLINSSPEWLKIGVGLEHSLAIKTDSTLWVWGRNTNGQTGDTVEYLTALPKTIIPKMIPSTATWKEIDGGNINSIAIKSNGEINTTGYGFVQDAQLFHSELGYTQWTPLPTNSCIFCPPSDTNIYVSICSGTNYLFHGNTLTSSGVYTQQLLSLNGCDSTVYLNLTVYPPTTDLQIISSCDSYTWALNGTTYSSSGTYTHVGTNANGCTLTTTLNLTINNSTTATVNQTACDSYTWPLNGTTYTTSGNYTHVGTNASGCSLTTTLNLTINNSTTVSVSQTACDSYTWALNGTTYTTSGIYTHVGINASGCPLTTTLNLTINSSSTATVTETACDSYTWALNGTTYTTSGNYTHVGTNASGCPLTTTLNLTINNSTTATVTETACDSYTWPLTGMTYTTSGTYTHVGTNAPGCPLTTTLNLTINNSTTASVTETACDSYTWALNGTTYTTSGTYTHVGTNAAGCQLTTTLNLTINTVNVATTLSGTTINANASGASYQWINCNNGNAIIPGETAQAFTPTANGNYAVIVTTANCSDTSACQAITTVEIDELGASALGVYPNPTSGTVKVILGEHYPSASIHLFNALGQVILHKAYSSTDEITFEIEGAKGVYFLEIETAEQVLGRIRVVKN